MNRIFPMTSKAVSSRKSTPRQPRIVQISPRRGFSLPARGKSTYQALETSSPMPGRPHRSSAAVTSSTEARQKVSSPGSARVAWHSLAFLTPDILIFRDQLQSSRRTLNAPRASQLHSAMDKRPSDAMGPRGTACGAREAKFVHPNKNWKPMAATKKLKSFNVLRFLTQNYNKRVNQT
eukprot:scaffold1185_cov238-Pinguiococcus_pyrenoidosus.AAC.2